MPGQKPVDALQPMECPEVVEVQRHQFKVVGTGYGSNYSVGKGRRLADSGQPGAVARP
jgi:hypothetical protein